MKRFLIFLVLNSLLSFCHTPKITVLTSVFKGDKFIRNFMEEIVKQTIFDQSELLMIDANSPENERDVIFEFVEQYPNIIYIRLAKDPGIYGVWNYGIHLSRGKYLTNANLDDRYDYRRFEMQAKALDENCDVDFVCSDHYIINRATISFSSVMKTKKIVESIPLYIDNSTHFGIYFGNAPMWRRRLHHTYGLFDESYKSAGDAEFSTRAMLLGAKYKKLSDSYSYFYNNQEGISTRPDSPGPSEWDGVMKKYCKLKKKDIEAVTPYLLSRPLSSYIFNVCDDWQECNDVMSELAALASGNNSELICIDFEKPKKARDIVFKYMKKMDNIIYIKFPKKFNRKAINSYAMIVSRGRLVAIT